MLPIVGVIIITGVWTTEGWLYVAVVLDLFSRQVVGWAMAAHRDTALVEQARRWLCSSDSQQRVYCIIPIAAANIPVGSISPCWLRSMCKSEHERQGDCYDNAAIEPFFISLKGGWTDWHTYQTRREAQLSIFEYIEVFYDRQRRHSTLAYLSSVMYEQQSNG